MEKKIFLSHASKDVNLVECLVDFFELGMKIERDEIYCTSLRGTIPTGYAFVNHMKENIQNIEAVIFLITPNYLESKFCLAEMGAAWVLNQKIYPIIVKPLGYDVLEDTPLKGVQAKILNSKQELEVLYDEFKSNKLAGERLTSQFNRSLDKFLSEIEKIPQAKKEEMITEEKYASICRDIEIMEKENEDKDDKIRELRKTIVNLELLKDREEVQGLKREKLNEWEKLEGYLNEVEMELDKLDDVVVTAIYMDKYVTEYEFRPNLNDYPGCWQKIKENQLDGLLTMKDGLYQEIVVPNYNNIRIKKLSKKLDELESYISDEASEELYELFQEKYEMELNLRYRVFWSKILRQEMLS